jgi:transposase InsO family protein
MSKQSFHQKLNRQLRRRKEFDALLPQILKIRETHRRMSSRVMYKRIAPPHLGRDRFEAFCFKNGFKVKVKRAFHKTTNSLGTTRFSNLVEGTKVTGVNQVWASDITYYRIGEKFYYLTFIMDLYSRFVVGYSASRTLRTAETTIPALKMAYQSRQFDSGLIVHSDGGGQYYDNEWKGLTQKGGAKNSMCESVYGNGHAERLNGTLKNDYIIQYGPRDYQELKEMTNKAVLAYNYDRPHASIGHMCPADFEKKKDALNVDNSLKELPTFNTLLQQQ